MPTDKIQLQQLLESNQKALERAHKALKRTLSEIETLESLGLPTTPAKAKRDRQHKHVQDLEQIIATIIKAKK